MKELYKTHNNLFQSVFLNAENARDLVRNSLPNRITRILDLESIKVSQESFVDRKLATHQSDILIRTKLRQAPVLIYILVEHKSYTYRWTVFQLLKYMVRIWEKEITQNSKIKKLTPIIPLIFYHGRREWKFPLDFSFYFNRQDELEPYIPDFRSNLFNLQQLDDKDIRGSIIYQAALKAFKHGAIGLSPYLGEMLQSLSTLPFDEQLRAFLCVLFEYILAVSKDTTEESIEEELLSIDSKDARGAYMTIAEKLIERGKAEGKLEGRAEGKAEGEILDKQNILLRLLDKKFGGIDEAEKKRVMNIRERDRLDRAIDLILDPKSIDEVLHALEK